MDVLYSRCCGIDIHKKSITVCVLIREPGRKEQKQIREFGTTTAAILSCADWLRDLAVTHVAMESTGVFWRPVWIRTACANERPCGSVRGLCQEDE